MNQQDRDTLNKLHTEAIVLCNELEALKQKAQDLGAQFTELADAEQSKLDNMPEGLQASEKGEKMQEQVDALTNIASNLESFEMDDIESDLEGFPL